MDSSKSIVRRSSRIKRLTQFYINQSEGHLKGSNNSHTIGRKIDPGFSILEEIDLPEIYSESDDYYSDTEESDNNRKDKEFSDIEEEFDQESSSDTDSFNSELLDSDEEDTDEEDTDEEEL